MPATRDKIITRLLERRQIEADLRDVLEAESELELRRRAQEIAALGSPVLPVLVSQLEKADARTLAALGLVAASLNRDEVTRALRGVVLQHQSSDRARMGAMTILEHFLGEAPDDDLLAGLADPEAAAISSLEDVLEQALYNPSVLVDYVQGLDRQEPDVVLAVIRSLREMGTWAVEPLRMMALDVREEIAAAALHALGAIRLPEAAAALHTLLPIMGPALVPQAERLLRKLHFSGLGAASLPTPSPQWRALVGAVDGLGQRLVWFIQETQGTDQTRFLSVLVSDRAGAVRAVAHTQVPTIMLPPRRPHGYVHDLTLPDGSGAMLMLEAPFELGRRLVREALATNRETQIPVAGALRRVSPWLWGCGGADPPPCLLPEDTAQDLPGADLLLVHPAFTTWTTHGEVVLRAAEEALRRPGWDLDLWVRRIVTELLAEPVLRQVLSRRLLVMSEWLLLAGEGTFSRLAAASGRAIQKNAPEDQLFLQAMVRRDLERAVYSLKQEAESSANPGSSW